MRVYVWVYTYDVHDHHPWSSTSNCMVRKNFLCGEFREYSPKGYYQFPPLMGVTDNFDYYPVA